ncbi:hypothetical protein [Flavobacterium daejeonense]|uniref:hypothetical protein n=1 Tax=Flavobacterium daejeonense TaxID=350893 RepID=UPI0004789EE2|nr:hypothetical protein [Flavobacterium daejeonense]
MKKIAFFLFLILYIISSCTSKSSTKEDYISNETKQLLLSLNKCYEKIVIIPGTGCSGCISESEIFLINNYMNKQILFILTNTKSIKSLNNKIGKNVKKLSNIYIDYDNVFSHYENPIYPVVVTNDCDKKKVNNVSFQSPDNNAFKNL